MNYKKLILPSLIAILLILLTIFLFLPVFESISIWSENPRISETSINVQTYYNNDFGFYLTRIYMPILVSFLSKSYASVLLILPFVIIILLIGIHDKVAQRK